MRYKQTIIGLAWALVRPVLTVFILTIVFGKLAKLPSEGLTPYPIMVFSGMLPWFLFSSIMSDASASLVSNANLISKVYFPRLIIPTAAAVVSLIDYVLNVVVLSIMMGIYNFNPNWHLLFLPVVTTLAVVTSLGPAIFIAALNVKYRDFRYVIPFIMQFGLYVSPVGFSSSIIPSEWRFAYGLNPVVGVIDLFRWCVLGNQAEFNLVSLLQCIAISVMVFWRAIKYFRTMENTFADTV